MTISLIAFNVIISLLEVLPIIKELHEKDLLRAGGDISFGGGEPAVLDEFEDIPLEELSLEK